MTEVMGQPELADDPRFATADARWENRAALDGIVEAWTRQHTKHEVMRLWAMPGFRAAPARTPARCWPTRISRRAR